MSRDSWDNNKKNKIKYRINYSKKTGAVSFSAVFVVEVILEEREEGASQGGWDNSVLEKVLENKRSTIIQCHICKQCRVGRKRNQVVHNNWHIVAH